MTLTRDSALQYVAIGLAVVALGLIVAGLLVESVRLWGVTLALSLAGNGVIVVAFALLTVQTLFDGGHWMYPPLFLVMTGNFIQSLVGPTDSNPLETVGFGLVLVGTAALFYLLFQRRNEPAADA